MSRLDIIVSVDEYRLVGWIDFVMSDDERITIATDLRRLKSMLVKKTDEPISTGVAIIFVGFIGRDRAKCDEFVEKREIGGEQR